MDKNDSLSSLSKEQKARPDNVRDFTQGVTERLLKKYKPSKVLNLIGENKIDTRGDIAA